MVGERSGARGEDGFAEELRLRADRLCRMILNLDLEWVDVAIQIERLRDFCREGAPEKLGTFERIYEARFRRLWEQWKSEDEGAWRR